MLNKFLKFQFIDITMEKFIPQRVSTACATIIRDAGKIYIVACHSAKPTVYISTEHIHTSENHSKNFH